MCIDYTAHSGRAFFNNWRHHKAGFSKLLLKMLKDISINHIEIYMLQSEGRVLETSTHQLVSMSSTTDS